VLWKIFGPKREEVMKGYKKLYNEELCDFYSLLDVIAGITSRRRRRRWLGHIACIREMRNTYKIIIKKLKETDHLEDLGVGGSIKMDRREGRKV